MYIEYNGDYYRIVVGSRLFGGFKVKLQRLGIDLFDTKQWFTKGTFTGDRALENAKLCALMQYGIPLCKWGDCD